MKTSCLLCLDRARSQIALCDDCQSILPWQQQACLQCAMPLPSPHTSRCGQCIGAPPRFDQTISLFTYETPVMQMIRQLKFHHNLAIANMFAKLWIHTLIQNKTPLPDCILPVPLHHKRLKERGFNQSLEIAKPIAKYFKIPIDTRTCIRIKNTKPQSSLPVKKRLINVANAFALTHSVNYQHIAILDDVMTTGKTASEIAGLLRKAGVKKVDVWCCARVP